MTEWEYAYIDDYGKGFSYLIPPDVHARLASHEQSSMHELIRDWGREGWEMVSAVATGSGEVTYWFKRPIRHGRSG